MTMTDKQQQKQRCKKKAMEYHFVDMNDPDRYKKIKVTRACDFCRKRKSKCDIGIPNSGTCSNCKKSKQLCIFSNVPSSVGKDPPAPSATAASKRATKVDAATAVCSAPTTRSTYFVHSQTPDNSFSNLYQGQHPYLSLDQRGVLGYEKHRSNNVSFAIKRLQHQQAQQQAKHITDVDGLSCDMTRTSTALPPMNEVALLNLYLEHIHPVFPILHTTVCQQIQECRSHSLPATLKIAILSISLFFSDRLDKATSYHQQASSELDRATPALETLQTFFLLYKFQELISPVGAPLSPETVVLLNQIQAMIYHFSTQHDGSATQLDNEYLCRANWMLYVIITMSSTADDRWRQMLDNCITPNRLPTLDTEQASMMIDETDWSTSCNLIYLININRIFARVLCLISDKSTLFVNADKVGRKGDDSSTSGDSLLYAEFDKIKTSLVLWRAQLPLGSYFTTSTNTTATAPSPASSTVISYLYLIHDIIDLIISIQHQSSTLHYHLSSTYDLFEKASNICYRAYHLFLSRGNDGTKRFPPRLTCVQGSRIISFGLTLALQTHCYYFHEQEREKKEPSHDIKRFYYSCSLAFQIFDGMSLSPHLYMAIETLRAQLNTQEQLMKGLDQPSSIFTGLPSLNSDGSSSSSTLPTPMTPLSDPIASQLQHHQSYPSNLNDDVYGSSMYGNSQLLQQLSDYNSSHFRFDEGQTISGKDHMCNHPDSLYSLAYAYHYCALMTAR